MKKTYSNTESKGLPGGPNEVFTYTTGVFSTDTFSTEGYKRNSPDVNNPYNIIPSGNITMEDVDTQRGFHRETLPKGHCTSGPRESLLRTCRTPRS